MEVENAINAMITHAKKQGNYNEGDRMRTVVNNPHFNRYMSRYIEDKDTLIEYIENLISSNEEIDITQCTFHIQISNIPRGQGRVTKRCITQIKTMIICAAQRYCHSLNIPH
jgi:hypothetical protein